MVKPMTEKQREKWSALRTRGWAWFVFVWGLLRYGLPWGVFMFVASRIHLFGMQSAPLKIQIPTLAVASALFGVGMGTMHWRREERRFQQSNASATSPA